MFTLEQINEAHSNVKSGADFPAYIQKLKRLGVLHYETYVSDGHTDYYGANGYKLTSPAKYETLQISPNTHRASFKSNLTAHQRGETDYPTFCKDAAKAGIKKWTVRMDQMTCTYYDTADHEILEEVIPR